MHSCSIMVESMSARNRRLRRWRPGRQHRDVDRLGGEGRPQASGQGRRRPRRRRARGLRPRPRRAGCGADARCAARRGSSARTASVMAGRLSFAIRVATRVIRELSTPVPPVTTNARAVAARRSAGGDPHCRADRLGQVGPRPGAGAPTSAGVVVNTDSMQVYADLRRLSARPSARGGGRGAPPPLRPCRRSGELLGRAFRPRGGDRSSPTLRGAGRLPIFVGGTGLYFRALEEGLSELPPVPDDVRAALRARAEGRPTEDAPRRPGRDATRPARRPCARATVPGVMRALEVFAATGRPDRGRSTARARPGPSPACRSLKLFLAPEREALRRRHRRALRAR